MQAELIFLIHLLRPDNPADEALDLGDEPDKDKGIRHVEGCVEGSKHKAQLSRVGQEHAGLNGLFLHIDIIAYPSAYHIDERTEDEQDPDDTKHVEEHVSQSSTTSLCVCRHRSEVWGNGGSDVLTHHQRDTLIDRQGAAGAENHRDSHHGCRRLYTEGHHTTQEQEYQGGEERVRIKRGEEIEQSLILTQMHLRSRHAEGSQTQQQEWQTKQEVADISVFLQIDQDDTHEEGRIDSTGDVERHTSWHNPCRQRGSDVSTHNDRDGLSQRQEPGIHKRDCHHRRCCRRLDRCRYQHTCQHTCKTIGSHCTKDVSQLRTRHLLQGFTHWLHTKHQKGEWTQKLKNNPNRHKDLL